MKPRIIAGLALATLAAIGTGASIKWWKTRPSKLESEFVAEIEPILADHCFECHGDGSDEGDFVMDEYESFDQHFADQQHWLRIWENLQAEVMPPAKKARLPEEERAKLVAWIQRGVFNLDFEKPDPGKVTIRRLNRVEYQYTIRDTFGANIEASDHLPPDDTGYGFDNIGDVLTTSPLLMEKYINVARVIVDKLEQSADPNAPDWRFPAKIPDGGGEVDEARYARTFLADFASRAFRRPAAEESVERLLALTQRVASQDGKSLKDGLRQAMVATLISPRFLYRAEVLPVEDDDFGGEVAPIDEFALASRLSYFLWKGPPDSRLLEFARSNTLRDNLSGEIDRLLADKKSERFVRDFVGQWLQIKGLKTREVAYHLILGLPLQEAYKIYSPELLDAMQNETEMLFSWILHHDRPAIELITANYTFLNEPLANFYDIAEVKGAKMRLVSLPAGSPRGGLLGHGSVLNVTSNIRRTSPVKRGVFVLENLLATPPPPAPTDVPELKGEEVVQDGKVLTLREKLVLHRQKKECSSCHARMDPIGFGMENFDGVGKWRTAELGGEPIDSSGQLISGEKFASVIELREILATSKRKHFHRALTEKLLTYGLGRGMELYDSPLIDGIVADLEAGDGALKHLIHLIVASSPFQNQRVAKSP